MIVTNKFFIAYTDDMRDFLHHLFFPRESNNHRARALHHLSLLLLIIVLFLGNGVIGYFERNHSQILGLTANFNQNDLLLETNAKRAENGLPPLQLDEELSQAAYQKGLDMMEKNYWAHNSPDGTKPWVFINNAGYEYLYAGENLARGFSSASDVVNAWMNSEGHRANILSENYDDVGFAVVTGNLTGDETILVVQHFGRRMAGASENIASATDTEVSMTPTPTETPAVSQATPTVLPSPTPIIVRIITLTPTPVDNFVASVQSNPLIDADTFSKNFTVFIILFLVTLLIIDIIVIERKKIVRVISHNVDHIIFLVIILLILLILSKEAVI